MKLFLSWSGKRSRMVAEALADWLPDVVQEVDKPWISTEIEKGTPGMQEIAIALQDCSYGIVCVTPENLNSPWINYEAGALSKAVGDNKARVATLLIGIESEAEVTGPIANFQNTKLNLDDFKKLIRGIDSATGKPRDPNRVDKLVDALWPQLEPKLNEAVTTPVDANTHPDKRKLDDKIDEILSIVRDSKRVSTPVLGSIGQWVDSPIVHQVDLATSKLDREKNALARVSAVRSLILHELSNHIGRPLLEKVVVRFTNTGHPVVDLPFHIDESQLLLLENSLRLVTGLDVHIRYQQVEDQAPGTFGDGDDADGIDSDPRYNP